MLGYLIVLFISIPLLEMVILIEVGKRIGTLSAIMIVVVTGIIGAGLARYEGLSVARKIHREISHGILPASPLMDGFFILMAGLLLITPGLLTDAVGFLLLVPPVRTGIKRWVIKRIKEKIETDHIKIYYPEE